MSNSGHDEIGDRIRKTMSKVTIEEMQKVLMSGGQNPVVSSTKPPAIGWISEDTLKWLRGKGQVGPGIFYLQCSKHAHIPIYLEFPL
jgi:hypothetical protein